MLGKHGEKHKDHDLHVGTIQKETHIETIEKEKLVETVLQKEKHVVAKQTGWSWNKLFEKTLDASQDKKH